MDFIFFNVIFDLFEYFFYLTNFLFCDFVYFDFCVLAFISMCSLLRERDKESERVDVIENLNT